MNLLKHCLKHCTTETLVRVAQDYIRMETYLEPEEKEANLIEKVELIQYLRSARSVSFEPGLHATTQALYHYPDGTIADFWEAAENDFEQW